LPLNVSNATSFTTYSFRWRVVDPSGFSSSSTNSMFTVGSSFTISTTYPTNFGPGSTDLVGNYSVSVDETGPANKPGVATGRFIVGLTNSTSYQRTSTVSVQAGGYIAGENVTISLSYGSTNLAGFPTRGAADSNGVFSYIWQSAPSVPIGVYSLTLQGSMTTKAVSDAQSFTISPANIIIQQLTVARTSLQRTETQGFRVTANYQSGVAVQSGSVTLSVVEADGSTSHFTTAYYDSSLSVFRSSFAIPAGGVVGSWAYSIEVNSFNDGYGNGGPTTGVTKGFNVQTATLTVGVSVANKTYTAGDVVAIYATVTTPDGNPVSSGTVTGSLSVASTRVPVGGHVALVYAPGLGKWAGSTIVNSTDPAGLWLIQVSASDAYGNFGVGSSLSLAQSPQPLSLVYFILAAAALGSGAASTLYFSKFNNSEASFDELYRLTGGEFQSPTTLMILGDSGSGTTTLALELIHRRLEAGGFCGILTYDAFPKELEKAMGGMGWNVDSHVRNGTLKFLDCYSALVGGEAPIRDPVDFTEVSIQVSSMVESAKSPVTILLDSFTPLFNAAQTRHAVNFLRVLGAKIKNDGGFFIMTGAKGSLPESVESNLESIVDCVIGLKMVRKGKLLARFLTVKKVAGRDIVSAETEFRIAAGKGILFEKRRISLDRFRPK